MAGTYWLYVVWDSMGESPQLVWIDNSGVKIDYIKRKIVSVRFYQIAA